MGLDPDALDAGDRARRLEIIGLIGQEVGLPTSPPREDLTQ